MTLHTTLAIYETAGNNPYETFTLATADFREWERSLYAGTFRESMEVKGLQWTAQITTTLGMWVLWHSGAGMLAGIWWHRQGRHNAQHLRLWKGIAAAGLAITATSLAIATAKDYHPITLAWTNWTTYVGGALLASAAIIGFTHARPTTWTTPAGEWLRACGRASLSIYLCANLMLAGTAQGWGLGLHSRSPPSRPPQRPSR